MAMLVATKSFYLSGWGNIKAGSRFDMKSNSIAKVLKAIGKAKDDTADDQVNLMPKYQTRVMLEAQRESVAAIEAIEAERVAHTPTVETRSEAAAAPPPEEPKAIEARPEGQDEMTRDHVISALRTRAAALGVDVDRRWGEERLRREIDEANAARYQRRDMQATE